ncbi:type IV pilus biogenesis/stability protein PilW [Saccharobesus litoralis]|uniref:Type IV pilus biogenesis/stability protein PilW n=1 Tax=Saccharobesus litoralis TaxID=2172099 RepID=A0A2S0VVI8_9ALTE|nr:type IV pilus biogenesis/stability protein PilW [Saccharobesus litoralis]AWB68218.1 type IV pilus biogenesis/stability protein PilW [Saccharobesus litoralis]
MRIIGALLLVGMATHIAGCVTKTTYAESGKPVIEREQNPTEIAQTRLALALRYINAGNYSQAKYNLDAALKHAPEMPEVHFSLAYYYQTVNELDNANQAYLKVLQLHPDNGDALNNYGTFLCQTERFVEAEQYFLKAVAQDEYIRESQTYVNLGVCLLENKQKQKAHSYLLKALEHNPYNVKALMELTELSLDARQLQEARNYLQRYEKATRSGRSARSLWLGYQIESQLKNNMGAEQYGRTLVRFYPNASQTKAYIELTR